MNGSCTKNFTTEKKNYLCNSHDWLVLTCWLNRCDILLFTYFGKAMNYLLGGLELVQRKSFKSFMDLKSFKSKGLGILILEEIQYSCPSFNQLRHIRKYQCPLSSQRKSRWFLHSHKNYISVAKSQLVCCKLPLKWPLTSSPWTIYVQIHSFGHSLDMSFPEAK